MSSDREHENSNVGSPGFCEESWEVVEEFWTLWIWFKTPAGESQQQIPRKDGKIRRRCSPPPPCRSESSQKQRLHSPVQSLSLVWHPEHPNHLLVNAGLVCFLRHHSLGVAPNHNREISKTRGLYHTPRIIWRRPSKMGRNV